jgi:hypothetical protein
MRIPFGVQSYRSRSLPLSAQRMVNCYLEPAPPDAKTFAAVVQSYGIEDLGTVGTGPFRGGTAINGVPYVVSGSRLYRIESDLTETDLGSIPGGNYVDMAGTENSLMLVTEGAGYYYSGGVVTQITDTDFPGAEWVEVIDGYFAIGAPSSGEFFISANRDPSSWDALDFATAEKYPDDLVGSIVSYGELVLFGRESGEVWSDSGDADFPLDRVPNGTFEVGLLSRFGAAKADNSVCFPGHDGIVYRLNGYTPERISTNAVEQWIEDAEDKNFYGITWTEGGHKFYALSSNDGTFVYDLQTQLWHEKQSSASNRWCAQFVLRAYNKWLVGDYASNKVGALDANTFTEWGATLRSSSTSPPVSKDNKRLQHNRLELVFEQGVGLVTGQGSDPQVMIRWSDDGGRTWSNWKTRSLGAIGEYKTRVIVNRCGQARDRIYEYAVSDPVRRTLILATTEAMELTY